MTMHCDGGPKPGLDQPASDPNDIKTQLEPFVCLNPEARISDSDSGCQVVAPWGDENLAIRVAPGSDDLIDALNHVRMPPTFTALWHNDTEDLEFIFSVIPERVAKELIEKSFAFTFEGTEYRCDWAPSSERLMCIADSYRSAGPPSSTSYRNLESYTLLSRVRSDVDVELARRRFGVPLCFWLRTVHWDEAQLTDLALHINFYMRYFDYKSSQIMIHEPSARASDFTPVDSPHGSFPKNIAGRRLDPNLLTVWRGASETSDPFLGYLFNYQVLEYAALCFLSDATRRKVERTLAAPDACAKASDTARYVLGLVRSEAAMAEETQLTNLLSELVEPDFIWAIVDANRGVFSRRCQFSGGVVIDPLIGDDTSEKTFREKWPGKMGKSLRQIRNALAHPGSPGGGGTILLCRSNRDCLAPWLLLCRATASQVVLHFPS